jgi:dihydroflavonol-4-reductase
VKALVTGASGLIGGNIVRALLRRRHRVRCLVRRTSSPLTLEGLRVDRVEGDMLEFEDVRRAAGGCAVVFHAAAHYAYAGKTAEELRRAAVDGTDTVLRAAREAGVGRVVLTSSSVVFGHDLRPRGRAETSVVPSATGEPPYVAAKLAQDRRAGELARELGLSLVIACPTVSIGPRSPSLGPSNGLIVAYLRDPWRMSYPGGCNIVSAADVGRGHVALATRGESGRHYLLAGENLHWHEVHRMISELCGIRGPTGLSTHAACLLAAAAEELRARLAGRAPLTTREQARMIGRYYWYDDSRARALRIRMRAARPALAEALAWLVTSPHVSREDRTQLTLGPEVYAARARLEADEARLRGVA